MLSSRLPVPYFLNFVLSDPQVGVLYISNYYNYGLGILTHKF